MITLNNQPNYANLQRPALRKNQQNQQTPYFAGLPHVKNSEVTSLADSSKPGIFKSIIGAFKSSKHKSMKEKSVKPNSVKQSIKPMDLSEEIRQSAEQHAEEYANDMNLSGAYRKQVKAYVTQVNEQREWEAQAHKADWPIYPPNEEPCVNAWHEELESIPANIPPSQAEQWLYEMHQQVPEGTPARWNDYTH